MAFYDFICQQCEKTESNEQNIVDPLVYPECPEHGTMDQVYNFGIGLVKGVGSSPSRTSLGKKRKK